MRLGRERRDIVAAVLFGSGLILALSGAWLPAGGLFSFATSRADGNLSPDQAVSEAIAGLTAAGRHPRLGRPDFGSDRQAMDALYGSPSRPVWCEGGILHPSARQAIGLLREADAQGLVPDDYDAAYLEEAAARASALFSSAEDAALFDVALSVSLTRYLADLHRGRVNPLRVGFDYHAGMGHDLPALLKRGLTENDLPGTVAELEPAFAQYGRLKRELERYRGLARDPTLVPVAPAERVREGETYSDLSRLAALLHTLGDLPALREGDVYESPIVDAVKRFQARHGLSVDGVLGRSTFRELNVPLARRVRQIELALERLRWLPHAPQGRFLVANIPAFRLVAFEAAASERPAFQMGIVVGRASRTRTPLFADAIRYLVFRPFWHPPRSIIANEIVPAVRRDPRYLVRQELELVAGGDDHAPALPVTAANLERLAGGSLRVRQRPGPHNALGRLKFVFPNIYDVYLHDTPARGLFARARRDFSHGCIRVEDPAALAEFLLAGQAGWTRERIEAAMNGDRTLRVDLPAAVPVFIYYTTAIVRHDGTIEFYDDIYGKDEALDRALRLGPPRAAAAAGFAESRRGGGRDATHRVPRSTMSTKWFRTWLSQLIPAGEGVW